MCDMKPGIKIISSGPSPITWKATLTSPLSA
jgi:hypothetical protein